jgi:transposase-like protein
MTATKYTDQQKASVLAELAQKSMPEVAKAHGIPEPTIYGWKRAAGMSGSKTQQRRTSKKRRGAKPASKPASNGHANGHAELAPVPDTDAQLSIRGLTPFLRKELDAKLRGVVREELAAMFGGLKQ